MTDLFNQDGPETPPVSRSERRRAERRRSERRKNVVSFIVMIVALALLIGGIWFFIRPMIANIGASEPTDFPGPGTGAAEVVVANGDTGAKIGATLVEAGVVKTLEAFNSAYETNPNSRSIQAGTYELPREMRAVDAVAALLDPAYRIDIRITIPEGWTASQVFDRVAALMEVPREEVEETAAAVGDMLPAEAEDNLEGWLAPSTYTVAPGTEVEDVLTEMVERTQRTLRDLDVAGDEQYDVLVKASIVEKEVPEQYRPQVARVIENRLAGCSGDNSIGMDTTLVYAFGKQYSQITAAERESSPYNTRINPGLPPTPIGSPSADSIEAVLNPAQGDWCYFVTVNLETQETRFTASIAEHNENQAEYRRYLEELRSQSDDED